MYRLSVRDAVTNIEVAYRRGQYNDLRILADRLRMVNGIELVLHPCYGLMTDKDGNELP